jgi:hypothetical protein
VRFVGKEAVAVWGANETPDSARGRDHGRERILQLARQISAPGGPPVGAITATDDAGNARTIHRIVQIRHAGGVRPGARASGAHM